MRIVVIIFILLGQFVGSHLIYQSEPALVIGRRVRRGFASRKDNSKKYRIEGDILVPIEDTANVLFAGSAADAEEHRKWPGGVVPYMIDCEFDATQHKIILGAMREIEGSSCVRFKERYNEFNYIDIKPGDYGSTDCFSYVGRQPSTEGQDIVYGQGCLQHRNAVHELMHALGFYHEQNRADRDKYISVKFKNIRPDAHSNFELKDMNTFGLPYDYDSIMHYGPREMAINQNLPAMESKPPGRSFGHARKLSELDKQKINRMYNCGSSTGGKQPPFRPGPIATTATTTPYARRTTSPRATTPVPRQQPTPLPSSNGKQPPSTFCQNGQRLGPQISTLQDDCCFTKQRSHYTCSSDTTYWYWDNWISIDGDSRSCSGVKCAFGKQV